MRLCFVVGFISMVLIWPGVLQAQQEDPVQTLRRGADLAREEKFEEALGLWLNVIDRLQGEDLVLAYRYLGIAYMQLGMLPESWYYLTRYLGSSSRDDAQAGAWLQGVEMRLKQSHVKVSFSCEPQHVLLRLPASLPTSIPVQQACPLTWWFKPGKYKVHAQMDKFEAQDVEVDVRAQGDSGGREIRLNAVPPVADARRVIGLDHSGPSVVESSDGFADRTPEWIVLGGGVAAIATGGLLQWLAYSRNEQLHDVLEASTEPGAQAHYDTSYDSDVWPKELSAYILYGLGGAALVTSTLLWIVREPAATESPGVTIDLFPVPGGGYGGVSVGW